MLLDVNLPDGEGFVFCEWLRERSRVPVLFLTARDMEEDALKGYELGAEDYVTKPFSMKILLKKIDVILKRSGGEKGQVFDDGFLRIDLVRAKAEVNGKPCPVTPTEFRILQEFLSHKGQLLTYCWTGCGTAGASLWTGMPWRSMSTASGERSKIGNINIFQMYTGWDINGLVSDHCSLRRGDHGGHGVEDVETKEERL